MQLDRTRIAIRERSFADVLDLALRVIRAHALPLAATFAVGAVPMALFNHWMLAETLLDEDLSQGVPWTYLFYSLFWIVWELPLAAAPTTIYLGKALFEDKPSAASVAKDLLSSLPQLILFQVALRGVLTFFIITWPLLFVGWPYLNEILLLERNPWRKRGVYGASTGSRGSMMHARNHGELLGRWLASVAVSIGLVLAIWGALLYLQTFISFHSADAQVMYAIHLQVAVWIVISYFMVVRYLSYLDLRIRTEGWEIELTMRAEAARLTRQLA
ncbi:MAG TPA: hypothetical protein VMV69_27350 [Pirellulales bacterium]|nr:hypothetical protein [Pirellulales bacterium]